MGEIKIIDESGDKKYFTQLPSIILNHSTANDQSLYWQMKRYSGENGKCFATAETIRKKMKIGVNSYNKSLNYLLKKGWIKYEGMTKSKTRPIKTYSIINIWKENIMEYEKILPETTISFNKEILPENKGDTSQNSNKILLRTAVEEEHVKEEHIKNIPIVGKADEGVKNYNFDDKLNLLLKEKRRDLQIIGLYWKYKGFRFINEIQWQSALKRELRPSKQLEGYSNEEIENVLNWLCDNVDFKWTLESVYKYIDENLNELPTKKDKKYVNSYNR